MDPQFAAVVDGVIDADVLEQFDRDHVAGFGQCFAQPGGTVKFLLVIPRLPGEVPLGVLEHDG